MWFTDRGKYYETYEDHGAAYYAKPDGSFISRQLEKLKTPKGIRLSPDGSKLYYAETTTGRIWSYSIQKPGLLDPDSKKQVIGLPGYQLFDSYALEAKTGKQRTSPWEVPDSLSQSNRITRVCL
jgi:gluconolactonase